MSGAERVVLALAALEKPRDAVFLAQGFHPSVAPGQQLVRIALVADVPHDLVARRVERVVQRDGQLDDAEPGADVASGARADVDQARANVVGQSGEARRGVIPRMSAGVVTRSRTLMGE